MKYFLLIFILSLSFQSFSKASFVALNSVDPKLRTACFITINSSEEKELFIHHLSKIKGEERFNFVELVLGKDWLKKSCESDIRCDILLISGHFAGKFFGDHGELSLENLESLSCSKECSGIINAPKEVFLLGCNTLSGKEEDTRTIEEYVRVLIEDGYSLNEAHQRAEERYGQGNASNKERFQNIFRGVPYIYGFSSLAPSGKNIEPLLKTYLDKVGDYAQHLTEIELQEVSKKTNEIFNYKPNLYLEAALRPTAFASCSGGEHSKNEDEVFNLKCLLLSNKVSTQDKLSNIYAVMKNGNVSSILEDINYFLSSLHPESLEQNEKELFDKIENDKEIKEKTLHAISEVKLPLMKLQYAEFTSKFGWLDAKEGKKIFRDALSSDFKSPLTTDKLNFVCSYSKSAYKDDSFLIDRFIKEKLYQTNNGWQAVNCFNLHDSKLKDYALTNLNTSSKNEDLYNYLIKNHSDDKNVELVLMSKLYEDNADSYKLAKLLSETSELSWPLLSKIIEKGASGSINPSFVGSILKNKELDFDLRKRWMEVIFSKKQIPLFTAIKENIEIYPLSKKEEALFIKNVFSETCEYVDYSEIVNKIDRNNVEIKDVILQRLKTKEIYRNEKDLYLSFLENTPLSDDEIIEIAQVSKIESGLYSKDLAKEVLKHKYQNANRELKKKLKKYMN